MKKWLGVLVLIFSITLVGCGDNTDQGNSTEVIPERLNVELTVPETANVNEDVLLQVKVSQGDEAVDDADEVSFELKNIETEENQTFDGKLTENGVYTSTIQLDVPGTYTVISHVTARDLHTMPSEEMVVEGDKEVAESDKPESTESESHSHGVEIHFSKPDDVVANNPIELSTHIESDGKPLTLGDVTFEIWRDGAEKHDYIDSEEGMEGMYKIEYTFPESGSYIIQVHVKADEIHDHQEFEITVE